MIAHQNFYDKCFMVFLSYGFGYGLRPKVKIAPTVQHCFTIFMLVVVVVKLVALNISPTHYYMPSLLYVLFYNVFIRFVSLKGS